MKGIKVILAAITAASIAHYFKRDYAVLAFSSGVTVLRPLMRTLGLKLFYKYFLHWNFMVIQMWDWYWRKV
ncbi:hypothetical protein [Phosphitispora fastidiosa]|uniref:hypothetical protein n=1 Tax=Phosphitispora fastidiosa TaxID=2837202 RepID=UPI001E549B76|nr:hypothetical protein [Phosphitispora fastidiosa]MBU7005811.1 hypothetical protein [Phosphitispora fastidiosa]